jgi:hypothetical protein
VGGWGPFVLEGACSALDFGGSCSAVQYSAVRAVYMGIQSCFVCIHFCFVRKVLLSRLHVIAEPHKHHIKSFSN